MMNGTKMTTDEFVKLTMILLIIGVWVPFVSYFCAKWARIGYMIGERRFRFMKHSQPNWEKSLHDQE